MSKGNEIYNENNENEIPYQEENLNEENYNEDDYNNKNAFINQELEGEEENEENKNITSHYSNYNNQNSNIEPKKNLVGLMTSSSEFTSERNTFMVRYLVKIFFLKKCFYF